MGKDLKGKELGKGISQRSNGRYYVRFTNRFGKRDGRYTDTLKEAKNILAKLIAEDVKEQNVVDSKETLDDWYEKWMSVYKMPVIRANTKKHYEYIYKTKISPVLGKRKITEITKLQITALLNDLAKNGYQWETLNKVKLLLTDMFNRAMEDEFLNRNPAKSVRLPKNKPIKEIKALSKEMQDEFFECSSGTFYNNLFLVAVNSGLRPGELYALTEKDLDFEKNEISVTKTLLYQKLDGDDKKTFHIENPKTGTSYRIVPMNSVCKKALLMQVKQHKIVISKTPKEELEFPDLLFTTKYGTPLNAELYSSAIKKIVEEMNVFRDSLEQIEPFSGHAFRHTFATRCFEAGIDAKTVQAYLGHATLQMTMDLYTSVLPQKKQTDMEKFESYNKMKSPDLSKFEESSNKKIISFCG